MKRIIITGGAGFVGSNLVRTLRQQFPKAHILVIDDLRVGSFANLTEPTLGAPPFNGNLVARPLSDVDMEQMLDDIEPDVVFHEASITDTTVMDEAKMMLDNVEPFHELMLLCSERQVPLVYASSAATYGTSANGATAAKRPFRLEDAGRPANIYGFSKWVMENLHRELLRREPKSHIVGLRYFNVFGPGEQRKGKMSSMIWQLAQQMLAGQRPRIFRDGEQARDQVYVQDVVDATIAAADRRAVPGIYNVGSGKATSFNQIIAALNRALGTNLEPDYIDNPYAFYQDYTCADLSETEKGLRWKPSHDPEAAIEKYARWIADQRR